MAMRPYGYEDDEMPKEGSNLVSDEVQHRKEENPDDVH